MHILKDFYVGQGVKEWLRYFSTESFWHLWATVTQCMYTLGLSEDGLVYVRGTFTYIEQA